MDETLNASGVLKHLNLTANSQTTEAFKVCGLTPASLRQLSIKENVYIVGITPEYFSKEYFLIEFDFKELCSTFAKYCKDFEDDLQENTPSKALQFSDKILFEYGPYLRNKKKSTRNKGIRMRFPYKVDNVDLAIKTVMVLPSKDTIYKQMEKNEDMVITLQQASMLAMVTFSKAVGDVYSKKQHVLMTPICGTIFPRESIVEMAKDLKVSEVEAIRIINESTATGGQYLDKSDIACAVVAAISYTKRVSNKDIRNYMITKTIQQYSAKNKQYSSVKFEIYAKYALGGVPPCMDPDTLIQKFTNVQMAYLNARAIAKATVESKFKTGKTNNLFDKIESSVTHEPKQHSSKTDELGKYTG